MDESIYLVKTSSFSLNEQKKYIYAFSLGNTLIKANSNKIISNNCIWSWYSDEIKNKLTKISKGNNILIFCNLFNLGVRNNIEISLLEKKIMDFFNDLPVLVIISMKNNLFSKPYPNIFNYIVEKLISIKINKKKSYYVGEFIGNNYKKYNKTDIKFAENLGIKFYYANEYFYNKDVTNVSNNIILPIIK